MADALAPGTTWPLVGREAELGELARARGDRDCHGAVVVAEAGAGKSRLAREALAAAEREGALVEWGEATRRAAVGADRRDTPVPRDAQTGDQRPAPAGLSAQAARRLTPSRTKNQARAWGLLISRTRAAHPNRCSHSAHDCPPSFRFFKAGPRSAPEG